MTGVQTCALPISFVVPAEGAVNVTFTLNDQTVTPTNDTITVGAKNTVGEDTSVDASAPIVIDEDTEIVVPAGKVLTIRATASGARSGTSAGPAIRVAEGKKLTLSGEGTIKFEGLAGAGKAISVVGGTLVVDGVNLESNSWVIAVYDGDSTPSNVSVSNSKISGNQAGLTVHGDSSMANTVALNNVMIETKYCGVYLAGNSNTTITNSNVTVQEDAAVEVRAGSARIENSNLKSTDNTSSVNPNGSGTTTRGAALAVVPHETVVASKNTTVSVSGGSLSATWPVLVAARDNSAGTVNVNVTSDLFDRNGGPSTIYACKNYYPAERGTVVVNGTPITYSALGGESSTR